MTSKTLKLVQPFERQGKRLIAGRLMDFKTAEEATGRAERDAQRFVGVVAVQQSVDTETGELLEEPVILARYGELPPEFAEA